MWTTRLVRKTATFRLPWGFDSLLSPTLTPILPGLLKDLQFEASEGFGLAYIQLLKAISERNTEVLQACLEGSLYKAIGRSLAEFDLSKQTLRLVNETAPVTVALHNSSIHIGPFIDRAKNATMTRAKDIRHSEQFTRVKNVVIYKDPSALFALPGSFLLQLDCLIKSKAKLVLEDELGNVVKGRKDESEEEHLLRFEVACPKTKGILRIYANFIRFILYAAGDEKEDYPFHDGQWVIADLDTELKGNPLLDLSLHT